VSSLERAARRVARVSRAAELNEERGDGGVFVCACVCVCVCVCLYVCERERVSD